MSAMDIEQYLRWWTARKLDVHFYALKESVTAIEEYTRPVGSRSVYGMVKLSAKPAESFSFTSVARWPNERYEKDILFGILDVVLSSRFHPVLGVEFTLQEIGWHDVYSCGVGYYQAARQATEAILKRAELEYISHR